MSALRRPHDPFPPNDHALVAAVARGDLSALGELYDRYHRDVRRVLMRLGFSKSDSDDLVQATFLELPKASLGYEPQRELCRGWVCGIAVRLASRHRRSALRYLRALFSMGSQQRERDDETPELTVGSREEMRAFEAAFQALTAKKREAFVLLELEGLSAEEGGLALGVPAATMRTRLFQARASLRDAMASWDASDANAKGRGR